MKKDVENKLKHLEFIQNVITRMNSNSFLIKGWTITLVSALFALASNDSQINYILITYISIPLFWLLDGFYLAQERQYRKLYYKVSTTDNEKIDFDMNASVFAKGKNTWLSCIFSPTFVLFYGVTLLITFVVMFVIDVK